MDKSTLESRHCEYGEHAESWQWADAVRNAKLRSVRERQRWLVRGESEPIMDFELRAKLLSYSADTPRLVSRITGSVWKRPPSYDVPEGKLSEFVDSATRSGQALAELAQAAATAALWHGWSVALLDRRAQPQGAPGAVTQADAQALGLDLPYAVLFEAPQVLDWRVNADGLLSYVKLVSPPYTEGGLTVTEYREVIPGGIRLWRVEKTADGAERVTGGELIPAAPALAAAGRLPIAVCQYDPVDAMVSRSPLTESLQAERRALLILSDLLWDMYVAGHPVIKLWSRDKPREVGVGVTKFLHFLPPDKGQSREDATWMEITGSGLAHQSRAYTDARRDIWAQAGISPVGQGGETSEGASGYQLDTAYEKSEGNLLARVARMAEAFEWDILTLAALDLGVVPDWRTARGLVGVTYPHEFDLKSPARMLAALSQLRMHLPPDSAALKELLRRATLAHLPNLGSELAQKIAEEIESSGAYEAQAPDADGEYGEAAE